MSQYVTRVEIAKVVGEVFRRGGAGRGEILAAAEAGNRPEVVAVLRGLPERRYGRLNELWEELGDVPVGM